MSTIVLELSRATSKFLSRSYLTPDSVLMNTATIVAIGNAFGIAEPNGTGAYVMGMRVVIDDTLADGQFGFAVIQ